MISMGAEADAESGDLVAAVDGLFQFAAYGCSRPHAISPRSSVGSRAQPLLQNSICSTMSPNVKFRSGPAVRQENCRGRVSVTAVIRKPDSTGRSQSQRAARATLAENSFWPRPATGAPRPGVGSSAVS